MFYMMHVVHPYERNYSHNLEFSLFPALFSKLRLRRGIFICANIEFPRCSLAKKLGALHTEDRKSSRQIKKIEVEIVKLTCFGETETFFPHSVCKCHHNWMRSRNVCWQESGNMIRIHDTAATVQFIVTIVLCYCIIFGGFFHSPNFIQLNNTFPPIWYYMFLLKDGAIFSRSITKCHGKNKQ